jgi:hypothetical protein
VNGSTYKYAIGRSDLFITAMGAEMTAAIGLNTWMTLAGTSEDAHAAGDVAMLDAEVNPVIAALRKGCLKVVAIHHDMIGDDPYMIFLHYYGRGPVEDCVLGQATPSPRAGWLHHSYPCAAKSGDSFRVARLC